MSAKEIKIGQKTVDNFEILLKKMGGTSVVTHLREKSSIKFNLQKYFEEVKSQSRVIFIPLSSVGKWWSKLVKLAKDYDSQINNTSTSKELLIKKINECRKDFESHLKPPQSSQNTFSSLNSSHYQDNYGDILFFAEKAIKKFNADFDKVISDLNNGKLKIK